MKTDTRFDTPSSRHRFLKQAMGASAACAVPNIITSRLFGAAAPSNRINVDQIGCGSIADYYHILIHHRNFIDCVKSRQETICPIEMGIRCDTICHLSNIAARTGRAIVWNPEKEEIVGDPEAAKLLTRPSREKWRVWLESP
ncbi:MAG: hypothetical protein NTW21_28495 [Verrucomicrobia bacterium]|nr:hypothetical protein [Verrucomicrobiota bacterium]